jgi:hypothetical protein
MLGRLLVTLRVSAGEVQADRLCKMKHMYFRSLIIWKSESARGIRNYKIRFQSQQRQLSNTADGGDAASQCGSSWDSISRSLPASSKHQRWIRRCPKQSRGFADCRNRDFADQGPSRSSQEISDSTGRVLRSALCGASSRFSARRSF